MKKTKISEESFMTSSNLVNNFCQSTGLSNHVTVHATSVVTGDQWAGLSHAGKECENIRPVSVLPHPVYTVLGTRWRIFYQPEQQTLALLASGGTVLPHLI